MSRNITELRQINNHRYDYSKISGDLPLPNLVEIQTKSYAEFLEKGLDEVFRESSNIYQLDLVNQSIPTLNAKKKI